MSENSTSRSDQNAVHIEPWGKGDLPLLQKLLSDPAMTRYLSGPESNEQLAKRQIRYEQLTEKGLDRMFKIIHKLTGEAVGSVGYWESTHHNKQIYEIGWSVLPAFQGQGIASAATRICYNIKKRTENGHLTSQ